MYSQNKTITLEGKIEKIIKSNFYGKEFTNNFKIIVLNVIGSGKIVVKGTILTDFKKNDNIEVMGIIKEDKKGLYIEPITYSHIINKEKGSDGWIEDFLQTIKGIGKVTAKRIIKEFEGEDFYEIVRTNPERLSNIKGISQKSIEEIYRILVENVLIEDYIDFIVDNGGTLNTALKTFKLIEEDPKRVVGDNPYTLLGYNIPFTEIDKIAYNLGFKRGSSFRVGGLILKTLQNESGGNGNTFIYLDELYNKVRIQDRLDRYQEGDNLTDLEIKNGIMHLIRKDNLTYSGIKNSTNDNTMEGVSIKTDDNNLTKVAIKTFGEKKIIIDYSKNIIYLDYHMKNEEKIAEYIEDFVSHSYPFKDIDSLKDTLLKNLDNKQRKAIDMAINNKISILTGGPGTGKTYTLKYLIKTIKNFDPNADIVLTAPTGKASRRMEEVTGTSASTIHKLINYIPDLEDMQLKEIEADFLIVDESSMISSSLFNKLLSQVSNKTQVLLVGDTNQLPAIGAGDVLGDLISSGIVPTVELSKVFRQEAGNNIIENSYNILNKRRLNIDNKDMFFISNENYKIKDIQGYVAMSINNMMNNLGYSMEDIQVLTPVKDGHLGVVELNNIIQKLFNNNDYSGVERNGYNFKIGDKVINVRNNYDLEVLNGEIGTIKDITEDIITVDINGTDKEFRRSEGEFSDLELAYALTVHKSQGSQYKVVIFPVHNESRGGSNSNLVYTAVTRASEKVVLVGHESVFYQSIQYSADKRNTMLPCLLGKDFDNNLKGGIIDFDCEYKGLKYNIINNNIVYDKDITINKEIFDKILIPDTYNPLTKTSLKNKVVIYKLNGVEDIVKIKNSPNVKHYVFYKDLAYVLLEYKEVNGFVDIDVILDNLEVVEEENKNNKPMILF